MTSYQEALKGLLANITVLDVEEKPLLRSVGQVLAEDVSADFNLPASRTSGPDGYAVRSKDVTGASRDRPVVLAVTETVRAGRLSRSRVKQGTAVRIMTGSVVPDGADSVVRFEDTDEPGGKDGPGLIKTRQVKIYVSPSPGANIRPAGSNAREGSAILSRGALIGPAQISALAALGKELVKVVRRPVIGVIATGDELVRQGTELRPGKTYDCNTAAMASFVIHYGGIPKIFGIARDNEASVRAGIEKGMTLDAVITTGGVSMGDFDLVRLTLGKLGRIVFTRIRMAPGAAVAFGVIPRALESGGVPPLPVFALTGPPAGCLINFETLVRPAILKMRGFEELHHPAVCATAVDSVLSRKPIAFAKWTKLTETNGKYRVELNVAEKIGGLASIAASNSLTIIPEGTLVRAGDEVQVLPLDWCRHGIHS
jgi:molybdopterin molybdotransferase